MNRRKRTPEPHRIDLEPAIDGPTAGQQVVVAAGIAAAVSGLPSTLYAVVRRRPLLEATEAAGSLLLPRETRRCRLLLAAGIVHLALSLFWAAVIARVVPRKDAVVWGAVAGVGIGVVDLVLIGRRWDRIRRLPLLPQLADHAVFGAVIAAVVHSAERKAQ